MKVNSSEIAFAVITSYPKWYSGKLRSNQHTDKIRGDLAHMFVNTAVQTGYNIVVVDGNSAKTWNKQLPSSSLLKLLKRRVNKSGPHKRLAIKKAVSIKNVKVIILCEPEKTSLLDSVDKLIYPIIQDEAKIVVPKRNDELFKKTYPNYMYESELEGNKIYNETLRASGLLKKNLPDLDFFFGPRVLVNEKNIISLFMHKFILHANKYHIAFKLFDPEDYSNIQFFPIIQALKKKISVTSVEIPFEYPKIQKENETSGQVSHFVEKRRMQRLSLLVDLMHFINYIEHNRSTAIKKTK